MTLDMLTALGGLGLFLLGMVIMTDALKTLAGSRLRNVLMRFTKNPVSGAGMGTLCTAVLQSSSATTVAAVGFVAAGLMNFQNALGIIFGANLGTTVTGWLVVLLGFKIKLGILAYPILMAGMVMRLVGHKRVPKIGLALAGFALIFIGVDTLQQGMHSLRGIFDFTALPADSWSGRLQLVVLGVLFTLVTQSSSAGVAATLTVLFAGMIELQQAAALVIGMDIGTTVTAAMATIGGTLDARRTGYSHVIYNVCTGILALFIIDPYLRVVAWFDSTYLLQQQELVLVGFHTTFNLLGVIVVIPVARYFAAFVVRLVPDRGTGVAQGLEPALLEYPEQALDCVNRAVVRAWGCLLRHLLWILASQRGKASDLKQLQAELDQIHRYLDLIEPGDRAQLSRLTNLIHILDHLQRLHERCDEEADRAKTCSAEPLLRPLYESFAESVAGLSEDLDSKRWSEASSRSARVFKLIDSHSDRYRNLIANAIARGEEGVPEGTDMLEAVRWSIRVSRHLSRISYYQCRLIEQKH